MGINNKTVRIFWNYTRKYRALFLIGSGGAVLGVITQDIIGPLIVSKAFALIQNAYSNNITLEIGQLTPYLFGFMFTMIIGVIFWRLQAFAVWQFEIRANRDISLDIFNHLQHQDHKFHTDRFGGSLVSQTNKFTSAYERLMDEFIWSLLTGVTTFLFSVGVLFFMSYKYAIILALVTILYVAIMYLRMKIQFPLNREEARRESEQTAALADAITNVSTVRSYAREEYELDHFSKVVNRSYDASQKLAVMALKNDLISHSMTNTFHIIAFLFGILAITTFDANASVLYLILVYTQSIVGRLWQFGRIMRNINRSFGDASDMTEILGIKPAVSDPKHHDQPKMNRGEIIFNDVRFYYEDTSKLPLFPKLNLKIKPGEKIGLVGPSGGGKTTLTKLLLRFFDIQNGSISIDGQDITKVKKSDLRARVSYVPQEPLLFHRTLMDNIRYGQIDASDEAVIAAAKMSNAHEFIDKLPKKYETMVGERGIKLSGGQRQRVAIARAMLKNAPILVLDEATSALDSESEVLIQDALWKLMQGRTAIVIAHRLSTVQKMDRIIVLEDGKITEEGSHNELLRRQKTYASLWSHQSGGFLEN